MRRHERILVKKDVVINGIIKAHMLDISEGGMYVHTQAELIRGAVLELKFDVDTGSVNVKAVVRNTQTGIGAGLQFVDLNAESLDLIKKFIQSQKREVTQRAEDEERGRKILLVDDSAQSRAIYRNKLTLEGFTVIEASDGVEALKHLSEMSPSLVILDLWMEGIDGFKMLQMMGLNPALKNIPVIVLSARSVPSDIEKAMALGARDFLPKMTTTPVKLAQKVKEILASK